MSLFTTFSIFAATGPTEGVPWLFRYEEMPEEFQGDHYHPTPDGNWEIIPHDRVHIVPPGMVDWWNLIPKQPIEQYEMIYIIFMELEASHSMVKTDDVVGYQVDFADGGPRYHMGQIMQKGAYDAQPDPFALLTEGLPLLRSRIQSYSSLFGAGWDVRVAAAYELLRTIDIQAHEIYPNALTPAHTATDALVIICERYEDKIFEIAGGTERWNRSPSVWVDEADCIAQLKQVESRVTDDKMGQWLDLIMIFLDQMVTRSSFSREEFQMFSPSGPFEPVMRVGEEFNTRICQAYLTLPKIGSSFGPRFYVFSDGEGNDIDISFAWDILQGAPVHRNDETLIEPGDVVYSILDEQQNKYVVSSVSGISCLLSWQSGEAVYNRLLLTKTDSDVPADDVPIFATRFGFRTDFYGYFATALVSDVNEGGQMEETNGHVLMAAEMDQFLMYAVKTGRGLFWVPPELLEAVTKIEPIFVFPQPEVAPIPKMHQLSTPTIGVIVMGLFVAVLSMD